MKRKPAMIFLALACWAALVFLAYLQEHERQLGFAVEALRTWVREPVTASGLRCAVPVHARGAGAAALCVAVGWLAAAPLAQWFGACSQPLRLALGLGAGSLCLLAAGLTGLFYPGLFMAASAVVATAALFGPLRWRKEHRVDFKSPPMIPAWLVLGILTLACCSALFNCLGALAPEVGYDSLIQHLADPRDYLRAHRVYFKDLSFLSQHPAGLQMLYAWLLPLGDDTAPMLFHWMLGLLACWAFWRWLARFWPTRDAAVMAAALYLTPFFGILSARAYVDLGLLFFSAAALLAPWGSWLQGVLLGMGIGIKYSGGILLAGWILALGISARPRWRGMARVAGGAVLVSFCWGARNWLNVGDPVYPFGFSILGGLGWDGHSASEYLAEVSSYGRVTGISGHLALPWLTFVRDRGALDDGSLGALVLILAPLLLMVPADKNIARLGILAWALWLLYILSPRQARYAIPYLPPTFALLALCLRRVWCRWSWSMRPGAMLLGAILIVHAGVSLGALYVWSNPYPVTAGVLSRLKFLETVMEPRDAGTGRSLYMEAAAKLADTVPTGANCLMIGDAKVYYLPGRWQVNALFNPRILKRLVVSSADANGVAKQLKQRGITHILYNVGGAIHIEFTHRLYEWTDREEFILESFARKWLKPVWRLETSERDPMFLFFELSSGNHPFPQYLPGVDTKLAGIETHVAGGERAQARAEARELLGRYPSSKYLPARVADILAGRPD